MVIEGGCGWIQLSLPDKSDIEIRDLATELIPLCKESSTILTIENRPEFAKELGLHGVHISLGSGLNACKVREDLGPEAIVGTEVVDVESILALRNADIDYVTLSESLTDDQRVNIVNQAVMAKNIIPIVFKGSYTPFTAAETVRLGASGIATGQNIIMSDNPVDYTEKILESLSSLKN